ncbi:MAG: alpha/beta fold hydrolase [Prosthecobacter sp.]
MTPRRSFLTFLKRRWVRRLLIAALLLLGFRHWASRTEAPTLAPGVSKEVRHLTLAKSSVCVTLYHPAKDDNAPLVVIAHGFTRSKRYMAGWGAELASQGFLAAVPTQPALADHDLNARALADLVSQLRATRRVALMGHSMGGLTTLLAATKTPVDAWVGLDPVDMNGRAKSAAAKMQIPCAVLRAEPETWNMNGNATAIIAALPGSKFVIQVRGSTHLDAEWPTDLLGQLACGFVDAQHQTVFRRYAVAFLKAKLMNDPTADQVLTGTASDAALAE